MKFVPGAVPRQGTDFTNGDGSAVAISVAVLEGTIVVHFLAVDGQGVGCGPSGPPRRTTVGGAAVAVAGEWDGAGKIMDEIRVGMGNGFGQTNLVEQRSTDVDEGWVGKRGWSDQDVVTIENLSGSFVGLVVRAFGVAGEVFNPREVGVGGRQGFQGGAHGLFLHGGWISSARSNVDCCRERASWVAGLV